MSSYQTFLQLHYGASPFFLGNIWDVNSAEIFASSGYGAIGTSSHAFAVANGYKDGENISFEQLLQLVKRVTQAVSIPFTVDMEAGYSRNVTGITAHIEQLYDAGVVGINLEDRVPGLPGKQVNKDLFSNTILAVAEHIRRKNLQVFINIRTDAFLLGIPGALAETLGRIKSYENAGADGIFVPGITGVEDIRTIVQACKLPINVMVMPGLPGFGQLKSLGVKRISMGGFFFNKIYEQVQQFSTAFLNTDNFSQLLINKN